MARRVHLLLPWYPSVTFKIARNSENQEAILRISGRIDPEGILELKKQLEGVTEKVVLDLKEVTVVDLEAVRFLGSCVVHGIELRNCPPYISEWIRRER
jgi:anti-anti-sigma regulatory factor